MTALEQALLAAGGKDALARLVYADWLEEQGRPDWESSWWRAPYLMAFEGEPWSLDVGGGGTACGYGHVHSYGFGYGGNSAEGSRDGDGGLIESHGNGRWQGYAASAEQCFGDGRGHGYSAGPPDLVFGRGYGKWMIESGPGWKRFC